MHVGVWKPNAGLRYADVLVIEESPPAGQPPRVETFSFKSRDLSQLEPKALKAQLVADANDAVSYYGQTLSIRRSTLTPEGKPVQVQVQRVRLVYEGGALKPGQPAVLKEAVDQARDAVPEVEVLFQ